MTRAGLLRWQRKTAAAPGREAGRDGRRHLTDLVAAAAWPRWARQLASWAAVTIWGTLFYGACVAVVFVATARQAAWGGPIWWLPDLVAARRRRRRHRGVHRRGVRDRRLPPRPVHRTAGEPRGRVRAADRGAGAAAAPRVGPGQPGRVCHGARHRDLRPVPSWLV